MWLILGVVGTADACLNEMAAAEQRVAQQQAQREAEEQAERARLLEQARQEREAERVRRTELRRLQEESAARVAAEEQADRAFRARWGLIGTTIGVAGAMICAAFTAWVALRVERAGGRREVRYA